MRKLVLVMTLLAVACASSGPVDRPGAPAIKGVTLGTVRPVVLQKLGEPVESMAGTDDGDTGLGDLLTFTYPGLIVELHRVTYWPGHELPREFRVWQIKVTDPRWDIAPGVRVGMSRQKAIQVLGTPASVDTKDGAERLFWTPFNADAWLSLIVRDGRVAAVYFLEDWS